jgi:hypothetical protein
MLRTLGHLRVMFEFLFLLVVAVYLGRNHLSLVRFDRERIEIWAVEGQTQVTGLYHYSNQAVLPISFSLGVPFPVDSEHDWPAVFSVAEADKDGNILRETGTRQYQSGTVFRVWFWPHQEKWIRVDYIQGNRVGNARYILVTTRKWGRSLDHGEYILHLGRGLQLTSSSYPVKQRNSEGQDPYSFARANFLPDGDWDFSWRKIPATPTTAGGQP